MIAERKRKAFERRFRSLLRDMAAAGVECNDGREVCIFFESGHSLNVADAEGWEQALGPRGREKYGDRQDCVLFDITTSKGFGAALEIPGCAWVDCGAW